MAAAGISIGIGLILGALEDWLLGPYQDVVWNTVLAAVQHARQVPEVGTFHVGGLLSAGSVLVWVFIYGLPPAATACLVYPLARKLLRDE